jgi:hypothetical protein
MGESELEEPFCLEGESQEPDGLLEEEENEVSAAVLRAFVDEDDEDHGQVVVIDPCVVELLSTETCMVDRQTAQPRMVELL